MVLCFDIGGTSVKYGIADVCGAGLRLNDCKEMPTDAKQIGGAGIVERILNKTEEYREKHILDGVAVSTAGMVDPQSGEILYANENIPGYTGCNLKKAVEERFYLPCAVENDVNCAALGESIYGAGRGASSVLCMTVGTGIGGAVILNKKVWRGHTGSAGEVGYMPVEGEAFERLGSASALVRRAAERTGEQMDGKQIFSRAKEGDRACADAIDEMCRILAQGIVCGICLLNPEKVILGGGIMAQKEYLRPVLEPYLGKYATPYLLKTCEVTFAELGNQAGMAGAYYWWETSCSRVSGIS